MIAIIDYGTGNLKSIENVLKKFGKQTLVTKDPKEIRKCDAIILPGVGSFGSAAEKLHPLKNVIYKEINKEKPLLGICLGMQLLFESSEESEGKGLEIMGGKVVKFKENVKVPQMGWNQLKINKLCPLFKGVPNKSYVYFANSYYCIPDDQSGIASTTDYGIVFASLIQMKNVFGVQFHPEKSGEIGLQILKNFVELVK